MSTLTGTPTLVRLILRRDRVRIATWVIAIAVFVLASVAALPELYPTSEDRQSRAAVMTNPAAVALTGPGHGMDDYTIGPMVANELGGLLAVAIGIMSILLVNRSTRGEEEAGRTELVRAAAVGRHAGTAAALIVAAGVNLVLALLLAFGMVAAVADLPLPGSLLFAFSMAAVGLVFAAVSAVAAQVSQYTRAVTGAAAAVLGLTFVLRAIGDIGNGTLSWLSPIGWSQATRAYVDDRWWPLLLSVGLAALLTVVTLAIQDRRDVGAALVAPRPGRASATPLLSSPLGLAVRLQRASLIGWAVGVMLFGAMYGTLIEEVEGFLSGNPQLAEILGPGAESSLTDAFFGIVLVLVAALSAGYALQSASRLRGEESGGRAEPVLATATSRLAWAGSHLTVALVGGALVLLAGGAGFAVTAAAVTGDTGEVFRHLGAAAVHVPAVWLLVGLAAVLFGVFPRAVPVVWAVLAVSVVVELYGGLLQVPDWAYDLSPFSHTPQLPAEEFTATPVVALAVIAAVLLASGLAAFRRRDLDAT